MMFSDGLDAFWPLQTPILSLIALREASRGLVAYKGGLGDLPIFGQFGVKHKPKKKFPNVFRDTLWGYLRCFRMVLTHFGPSRPQFGSFITLCEASRGLGACKGGAWGLSRFRAIWGEK